MKFNTHYSNKLLSKLIRLFSQGEYDHTSIEVNGYVYEAKIRVGVIKTPVKKWNSSTVVDSRTLKISPYRTKKVEQWLNEQVGKKYDIFGVLSFVWVLFKEEKGRWLCSELAYVALMKALNVKSDYNQRKSPHAFWYDLGVIIEIHD